VTASVRRLDRSLDLFQVPRKYCMWVLIMVDQSDL
jgi:hypothetical protein